MIEQTAGYKRFGDMTLVELYRSNIRPEQHPTVKVTCRECKGSAIESYMPGLLLTPWREMNCSDCGKPTIFDFEWHDQKEDEMIEMLTDEFIVDSNRRIREARQKAIINLMSMKYSYGDRWPEGCVKETGSFEDGSLTFYDADGNILKRVENYYTPMNEEDRKRSEEKFNEPSAEPCLPNYGDNGERIDK